LANKFVSDPNEVVKLNQKVTVTVTEVDVARKRIGLTMKGEGSQKDVKSETSNVRGERLGVSEKSDKKLLGKKTEPLNPFQSKLMELKKKFND